MRLIRIFYKQENTQLSTDNAELYPSCLDGAFLKRMVGCTKSAALLDRGDD